MFQLGKRNTTRKNSPLPLPLPLRHPEGQSGGADERNAFKLDDTYWQAQDSAGCGRHALNNLFGGEYFIKDGPEIPDVNALKGLKGKIPLQAVCAFLAKQPLMVAQKDFTCQSSENYEMQVLVVALNAAGYSAVQQDHHTKDDDAKTLIGYIYNLGPISGKDIMRHWVAIRKIGNTNQYRLIDSMDSTGKATGQITGTLDEVNAYIKNKRGADVPNKLQVRFTGKFVEPVLSLAEKTTTGCPFELNDEIIDATGNHFVVTERQLGDKQECKSIIAVNIKTNEDLYILEKFDTYKKVVDKTVNCKFSAGQGIVFNKIQYSIQKVNFKDNQCDSLNLEHQPHKDDDTTKIVKSILFADYGKIRVLKPGEEWRVTPGSSGSSGSSGSTPANTSKFSLPLDDPRYNEVWNHCKKTLKQVDDIKGITSSSKVTLSLSADKSLSLLSNDKPVVENLSDVNAAKLLILFRYKILLDNLSKKTTMSPLDFFNQLESNREYHARQCVTLCLTSTDTKIPGIDKFIPSALDPLDKFIYTLTVTEKHFSPYELTFLINHMMVSLATMESEWFPDLITDTYASAISSADSAKDLPSHLRLLSRFLNQEASTKVSDVRIRYPQSLLLNYASFYPFVLYHTGVKPI